MTHAHLSGAFRCLLVAVWIAGAWAGVALGEDAGTTTEAWYDKTWRPGEIELVK